jgi:hypothetical protein
MSYRGWTDYTTNENIGGFKDIWDDNVNFPNLICPKCGKVGHYVEGQIGQDFMGNDTQGYWWVCFDCKISSDPSEA